MHRPWLHALVTLTLLLGASACAENPVGRRCFVGELGDAGVEGTAIVASPALECSSRTCLRQPLQPGSPLGNGEVETDWDDLCTAECSNADDCDKVPESPCKSGFECAIPVVVGPFCCRKLCVCKDYIVVPDGGLQTPGACDPDDSANQCCNLPGRENLERCGGS